MGGHSASLIASKSSPNIWSNPTRSNRPESVTRKYAGDSCLAIVHFIGSQGTSRNHITEIILLTDNYSASLAACYLDKPNVSPKKNCDRRSICEPMEQN